MRTIALSTAVSGTNCLLKRAIYHIYCSYKTLQLRLWGAKGVKARCSLRPQAHQKQSTCRSIHCTYGGNARLAKRLYMYSVERITLGQKENVRNESPWQV